MSELTKEYFDQQVGQLAESVVKGFESVDKQFEGVGHRFDELEKGIAVLEDKLEAIDAKLTTHLELSDKRYLELKRRDTVITKWVKQIADKTGVEIDLAELEKF